MNRKILRGVVRLRRLKKKLGGLADTPKTQSALSILFHLFLWMAGGFLLWAGIMNRGSKDAVVAAISGIAGIVALYDEKKLLKRGLATCALIGGAFALYLGLNSEQSQ